MERGHPAMHVAKIERRHGDRVYSYWLVRRSVREGKRVRHETVANVSKLPAAASEARRRALAGEALVAAGELFATERSLPHGQVQALLAMSSRLGLARLLDRQPSPERSRVLALICQQVLQPGSKLACTRALTQSTLAGELAVEGVDADELYAALDWLLERQERIERRLARRHLGEGAHVLYDVSSSYFEGRTCPLLALGYSRDRRRGSLQIVYGLLCDHEGRPVAIEVFPGGLHDDKTLPAQIEKLRKRFGFTTLVLIVDRGMTTKANLATLAAAEGIGWITALKAPQVKKLVKEGSLQLSLFDEQNLAEIASADYPGERLVVCRHPPVPADPSPPRGPRPRARLPLPARLLPRMAPPAGVGAAALHRRTAAAPHRPGRQSRALARRKTQGLDPAHRRRRRLPFLRQPAHRARPDRPQHQPRPRKPSHLRHHHPIQHHPGTRPRTHRADPETRVATNKTRAPRRNQRSRAKPRRSTQVTSV